MTFVLKMHYTDELRKKVVRAEIDFESVLALVTALFDVRVVHNAQLDIDEASLRSQKWVKMQYTDGDGDRITIGSQHEWLEAKHDLMARDAQTLSIYIVPVTPATNASLRRSQNLARSRDSSPKRTSSATSASGSAANTSDLSFRFNSSKPNFLQTQQQRERQHLQQRSDADADARQRMLRAHDAYVEEQRRKAENEHDALSTSATRAQRISWQERMDHENYVTHKREPHGNSHAESPKPERHLLDLSVENLGTQSASPTTIASVGANTTSTSNVASPSKLEIEQMVQMAVQNALQTAIPQIVQSTLSQSQMNSPSSTTDQPRPPPSPLRPSSAPVQAVVPGMPAMPMAQSGAPQQGVPPSGMFESFFKQYEDRKATPPPAYGQQQQRHAAPNVDPVEALAPLLVDDERRVRLLGALPRIARILGGEVAQSETALYRLLVDEVVGDESLLSGVQQEVLGNLVVYVCARPHVAHFLAGFCRSEMLPAILASLASQWQKRTDDMLTQRAAELEQSTRAKIEEARAEMELMTRAQIEAAQAAARSAQETAIEQAKVAAEATAAAAAAAAAAAVPAPGQAGAVNEGVGDLLTQSFLTMDLNESLFKDVEDDRVSCNGCSQGIRNVRYKCCVCPDYDLCAPCEAKAVHDPTHALIKVNVMRRHQSAKSGTEKTDSESKRALTTQEERASLRLLSTTPTEPVEARRLSSTDVTPAVAVRLDTSTTVTHNATAADTAVAALDESAVNCEFVRDETLPDASRVPANALFVKRWVLKNSGTVAWPRGCVLERVGGHVFDVEESYGPPTPLAPGDECTAGFKLHAPSEPGRYVTYWRLKLPSGRLVGHRYWCDVVVVAAPQSAKPSTGAAVGGATASATSTTTASTSTTATNNNNTSATDPSSSPIDPVLKQTYASYLRQLAAMGFVEEEMNIRLLQKYNGDVLKVVSVLLASSAEVTDQQ